jgi:hypothetical protein
LEFIEEFPSLFGEEINVLLIGHEATVDLRLVGGNGDLVVLDLPSHRLILGQYLIDMSHHFCVLLAELLELLPQLAAFLVELADYFLIVIAAGRLSLHPALEGCLHIRIVFLECVELTGKQPMAFFQLPLLLPFLIETAHAVLQAVLEFFIDSDQVLDIGFVVVDAHLHICLEIACQAILLRHLFPQAIVFLRGVPEQQCCSFVLLAELCKLAVLLCNLSSHDLVVSAQSLDGLLVVCVSAADLSIQLVLYRYLILLVQLSGVFQLKSSILIVCIDEGRFLLFRLQLFNCNVQLLLQV